MGYLGLVPSEHSSGGTIRRGGITKTGDREARRMLIEAAWSYQYPARIAKEKAEILVRLPKNIRDIAWKAQTRLCTRYRSMIARGKKPTVVACAASRRCRPWYRQAKRAAAQRVKVDTSSPNGMACTVICEHIVFERLEGIKLSFVNTAAP